MTDQLSLLPDLDRASDSRKQNLCATWKNARANDCDVLTENMMEFEARTGKKIYPCVRIKCALVYPKVYYECDVQDVTAGRKVSYNLKTRIKQHERRNRNSPLH